MRVLEARRGDQRAVLGLAGAGRAGRLVLILVEVAEHVAELVLGHGVAVGAVCRLEGVIDGDLGPPVGGGARRSDRAAPGGAHRLPDPRAAQLARHGVGAALREGLVVGRVALGARKARDIDRDHRRRGVGALRGGRERREASRRGAVDGVLVEPERDRRGGGRRQLALQALALVLRDAAAVEVGRLLDIRLPEVPGGLCRRIGQLHAAEARVVVEPRPGALVHRDRVVRGGLVGDRDRRDQRDRDEAPERLGRVQHVLRDF